MVTYKQPQQQIISYDQGYYGQPLEVSPGYQEENELKIISAKTHPKMVKEDDDVTKCLKQIEDELHK